MTLLQCESQNIDKIWGACVCFLELSNADAGWLLVSSVILMRVRIVSSIVVTRRYGDAVIGIAQCRRDPLMLGSGS